MVISLYVCYVLICYIIGYITFMSRERLSAKNADLLGAYHEIIRFESKCIFIWLTLMCILLVGLTNS